MKVMVECGNVNFTFGKKEYGFGDYYINGEDGTSDRMLILILCL